MQGLDSFLNRRKCLTIIMVYICLSVDCPVEIFKITVFLWLFLSGLTAETLIAESVA